MIKRRFTLAYENDDWWAVQDGDITLWKEEVITLLDELSEENEQLKKAFTKLRHRHSDLHDICCEVECERDSLKKDVESLEKENEQLTHDATVLIQANQDYRKENEQLRKENYSNLDGLNYYQEQNGYLSERVSELKCENEQLKIKNDTLQETLAYRSNQLELIEHLIKSFGFEELEREMEEILND